MCALFCAGKIKLIKCYSFEVLIHSFACLYQMFMMYFGTDYVDCAVYRISENHTIASREKIAGVTIGTILQICEILLITVQAVYR